jgi:DNA replication ATP-dependent helicase Dna2
MKDDLLSVNCQEIHVDNTNGLIVIHPDVLVTPTKIADSFSCSRKAVLSDRIRGGNVSSDAAVMGSLKHQFIEVCV